MFKYYNIASPISFFSFIIVIVTVPRNLLANLLQEYSRLAIVALYLCDHRLHLQQHSERRHPSPYRYDLTGEPRNQLQPQAESSFIVVLSWLSEGKKRVRRERIEILDKFENKNQFEFAKILKVIFFYKITKLFFSFFCKKKPIFFSMKSIAKYQIHLPQIENYYDKKWPIKHQ